MTAARSILLMARSNLARRKGQGFLVGAIVGLSALLFFTGVGVIRELETPVHTMLDRQRASQFTLLFDARIHDPDSVRAWWTARPEVTTVTEPMAVIELRESAFFRGKQLSRFLFVAERPLVSGEQDLIRIVDGPPAETPAPGQVWLPTSLAEETGIRPGDTLEIPGAAGLVPMIVSAIVVDPQFSAPFHNPTRIWVSAGELPSHFQSVRLDRVMVGVRLGADEGAETLWDAFVAAQGGVYSGSVFDRQAVIAGYTAPYALMAAMIVAFSALGFLVALFAIQGTVTSAILADFKIIGILRAQGFRPRDVRRVYEVQYLLLAAVALPIGVGLGVVVVRQTIALLTKPIATPVGTGSLFLQAGLILLLFLLLIYGFVTAVSRAAGRVRPADAIRYGAEAREGAPASSIPVRRLARLSVPMIMAIKNLALQKRRAAFLVVSVLFATLAAVLAINLDYSFGRMTKNLARFGFDAADVRVSRVGRRFSMRHEALMTALTGREGVRAVATWDGVDGTFRFDSTGSTKIVAGTVIDGDMEGLQYRNLRGRNPSGPREISLAIRSAEELGRDVGDRVDVHLLGATISYEVVGVYQSINNTGHGFRVRLEGVRLASPLWAPAEYAVALEPGVDPAQFIAALEAEYGEAVDAKPGDFFIRDQLATIMAGLRMTNGFLAVVFLLAASVFIFNTTLLTIAENRRIFGILKTAGMTPAQLRTSVVAGVGVQAAIGTVAGIAVWFLAAPVLLSGLFEQVGLVSFPLEHSVVGMAVALPLIFGFCLASAWAPSRRVLEVNARHLIVE